MCAQRLPLTMTLLPVMRHSFVIEEQCRQRDRDGCALAVRCHHRPHSVYHWSIRNTPHNYRLPQVRDALKQQWLTDVPVNGINLMQFCNSKR